VHVTLRSIFEAHNRIPVRTRVIEQWFAAQEGNVEVPIGLITAFDEAWMIVPTKN
jgi:hypothetical protein